MSLINDALKRATKVSSASGTGTGGGVGQPMRPADQNQSVALPRYFFPVLLCIFCGAMWFLVRGWDVRRLGATGPDQTINVQAREVHPAGMEGIPVDEILVVPDEHTPAPANRNFSLNDSEPARRANVAGMTTGEPNGSTGFRLQGIFYRPSAASAVINTETVFEGDTVSGARVKAIGRDSVTLEREGRIQVLTLRR